MEMSACQTGTSLDNVSIPELHHVALQAQRLYTATRNPCTCRPGLLELHLPLEVSEVPPEFEQ